MLLCHLFNSSMWTCPMYITAHLYLHFPWNVTKSSGGEMDLAEQWSLLPFRDDRCRKCSWTFRGVRLNVWKGLLTAAVYCWYISRSCLYHNDPFWSRSYHKATGTAIAFSFLSVELCAFPPFTWPITGCIYGNEHAVDPEMTFSCSFWSCSLTLLCYFCYIISPLFRCVFLLVSVVSSSFNLVATRGGKKGLSANFLNKAVSLQFFEELSPSHIDSCLPSCLYPFLGPHPPPRFTRNCTVFKIALKSFLYRFAHTLWLEAIAAGCLIPLFEAMCDFFWDTTLCVVRQERSNETVCVYKWMRRVCWVYEWVRDDAPVYFCLCLFVCISCVCALVCVCL